MSRITELEDLIKHHSELYYNDQPVISDTAFDGLVDELRKLAPKSSALAQVGAKPTSTVWPEHKHEFTLGSQLKLNSIEEFLDWARKIGVKEFCWSEKLDGSSLALKFEASKLVQGVSRGDGTTGSDITPNVLKMNAPKFAALANSASFWARGEVIMKKETFEAKYKHTTKNPRNAAAGLARRLDGKGCSDLGVVCYDVVGIDFKTEHEKFKWLEARGFFVPEYGVVTTDEMGAIYDRYVKQDREACPFEIDGLIVAVNDLKLQKSMGVVDNRPKGQRALKFPPQEKETVIKSVTWQTGRTGRCTPVGELEPTDIGGVTISRVMLNNIDLIEKLGLGVGSRAVLCRANDVIPMISKALSGGTKIATPQECPSCKAPTARDGVYLVCTNKISCPAQNTAHLLNFLRVLDVKGFGESTIEYLVDGGKLKSITDFYQLQPDDFESLKVGVKLVNELRVKAREMTLPVFIDALGIHGIGQHFTELAMQKFPTVEDLVSPSLGARDFTEVAGIGLELARLFVDGMNQKRELALELLNLVVITKPKEVAVAGSKCKGWTAVFTGFRDESLEEFIKTQGGSIASSANKSVTHVIAKDTTGSSAKLTKARERGLTVLSKGDLEILRDK